MSRRCFGTERFIPSPGSPCVGDKMALVNRVSLLLLREAAATQSNGIASNGGFARWHNGFRTVVALILWYRRKPPLPKSPLLPGKRKRVASSNCVRNFPNRFALLLIHFYKKAVSPFLPRACRFEPTCSVYARECFERQGFVRALFLSVRRVLRCHPFHPGGYDPAP